MAIQLEKTYRTDFTKMITSDLEAICQTMAETSSHGTIVNIAGQFREYPTVPINKRTYAEVSDAYKRILESNEIPSYEMSFMALDEKSSSLHRVVSSDPIYSYGEKSITLSPEGIYRQNTGFSEIRKINEQITKIIVSRPVMLQNAELIGYIQLETTDITDRLRESSHLFFYLIPVFIYFLMALILTPRFLKKRKIKKLGKVNESMQEEIRQKNSELKMLSLVAKKSENLMLISDNKGKILWVNETYEMKNNYTAEELNSFVGKYLKDVSKNPRIKTILSNVIDFKKSVSYESSGTDIHGTEYHAMTTVTPVINDDGVLTNLLFVDTDVTTLKTTQKENEVFKEFVLKSNLPRIHMHVNGNVLFKNNAASPLLHKWKDEEGKLKSEIAAMLQGICDTGTVQSIEVRSNGRQLLLDIHPYSDKKELYVIAQYNPLMNEGLNENVSGESIRKKAG